MVTLWILALVAFVVGAGIGFGVCYVMASTELHRLRRELMASQEREMIARGEPTSPVLPFRQ